MFWNVFYNLLQIILDIFAKTVISNLKWKTFVQIKGKDISKKKYCWDDIK